MSETVTRPMPEVEINLPCFVDIAWGVLHQFLDVIGSGLATVRKIRFSPSEWDNPLTDPPEGEVTFELRGNTSVTFYFRIRKTGEGPIPNKFLDRLEGIVHRVGFGGTREDIVTEFTYIEHRCKCKECRGVRYPFLPKGIEESWFLHTTEHAQLQAIRGHMGGGRTAW